MTLYNASSKNFKVVTISGGGGTGVTLSNAASNTVLTGTAYADRITNTGGYVTILANDGNDYIYNTGSSSRVNAGYGNDTIVGRAWSSSLFGNYGDDVISIGGGDVDGVTVNGGAGNDTIYSDGYDGLNYFLYAEGDGYDVLRNTRSGDRISITSGEYTRETVGSNVVLSVYKSGASLPSGAITVVGGTNTGTMPAVYGTIKPRASRSITRFPMSR